MKLRKVIFLSVFALILSGCGGGEDGVDPNASAAIPTQALAITSANAREVARITLNIAVDPINSNVTAINLISFSRDQLKWLDASFITNNDVNSNLTSIIQANSYLKSCDNSGSGSAAITFNDSDGDSFISKGDSFSIALDNCLINEDQATYNGNMVMTLGTITANPVGNPSWDLEASFTFDNFSIRSLGRTSAKLSGDLNFTIETSDTIVFTGTLDGNKLTYTAAGTSVELTNYLLTFESDGSNMEYTHNIRRGSLASTTLNGTFDVTTLSVLVGIEPNYPDRGTVKATGANSSSVTIMTIDALNVELSVNSDGVGSAESIINTTWNALNL